MKLEKLKERLRYLREKEHEPINMEDIQTDVRLQSRVENVIEVTLINKQKTALANAVQNIRNTLKGSKKREADHPVLLVDIEGSFYILDGHHRHRAYQLEKRDTILARVITATWREAAILSKLVNNLHRAVPPTAKQNGENCWQFMILTYGKDGKEKPTWMTDEWLRNEFNLGSTSTPFRYRHRLPKVNPKEFDAACCDPSTGWPTWKAVRASLSPAAEETWSPDAQEEQRARKDAAILDAMYERCDRDIDRFVYRLDLFKDQRREDIKNEPAAENIPKMGDEDDFDPESDMY